MKPRLALVALTMLLPVAWLFGGAVLRGEIFACRDATSFYYPLFQWECREWSAGRVPLWSPQDNLGVPLLADASSSVFYPGKLLFALPLDFPRRFALYIALHGLLAAANSWFAARKWGASPEAAALCAVSYVLGGSVLFQYSNVIFLVGAAWLPLAWLAAERMLTRRSYRWACALGILLALMVLGGDPQTGYHVMILATLYALFARRRTPAACRSNSPNRWGRVLPALARCRLLLLVVAGGVGYCLAAVQILPATEWTGRSERVAYSVPRSIWEVPSYWREVQAGHRPEARPGGVAAGLLGEPDPGTHHAHIYEFSVGPWRWAELLWPNFSGRGFPTNRRWISVIPSEGRAWTPSLYAGILPLVLSVAAFRFRRAPRHWRWISWCTAGALLSSLGWYGAGWLWRQFRVSWLGAPLADGALGQPDGGLYWLMVFLLPGYSYFRYPAKWLVVASLGLSFLAARGFDAAMQGRSPRLRGLLWSVATMSLAGALVAYLTRSWWIAALRIAPANGVFGPLDAEGAARDVCSALLQTGVVSSMAAVGLRTLRDQHRRWLAVSLLIVTAVDLAVANGWMVATIKPVDLTAASPIARHIRAQPPSLPPPRVLRASRWQWTPSYWQETASPRRLEQVAEWEYATLAPRYHLLQGVTLLESFNTLVSQDFVALLRVVRRHSSAAGDWPVPLLDILSIQYQVGPPAFSAGIKESQTPWASERVTVRENNSAGPRAWIVHDVTCLPPLATRDPAVVERRTQEVFFPEGRVRDLRHTAVVETTGFAFGGGVGRRDACQLLAARPGQVEFAVELKASGLLVWNDLYDPGWVAEATAGPLTDRGRIPILRTNRVLRGIVLPAGQHRIVCRYRPSSLVYGTAISVAGWLAVVLGAAGYWPGLFTTEAQRVKKGHVRQVVSQRSRLDRI